MTDVQGGTVLILEDDPGVARLERLRLERAGYATVVAATPEEALRAIEAGGVDLMVLDYKLGGAASGIDFHQQVRDAGFAVASILVTGFGDEEMLAQALRAGLRDFLPKTPQYLDFLAPTVGRVMGQVRTERALEARQRMLVVEQQRSNQLQRLAAISTRLNAALDLAAVLRLLAEEALELIGGSQSIVCFAAEGDWSRASRSIALADPSAPPPYPIPDGTGPGADVCRGNRPIRLDRDGADGGLPLGARGWLGAPLIDRQGRNMGLVQLFDKPGGPYTEDDESIVVQLAQMASVAVANARFYQELRDNDRRKDEFLAMLAHELRNPLAAIDSAAQVSRRSGLGEHLEWSKEVIQRQAKQLSRLIEDLLDISRINLGKIKLRRERLELAPIVARAVASVAPLIEAQGHDLSVALGDDPLHLEADPARLEQILVNLLSNAAKYTPANGKIGVKARREGDEVVVDVEDNGVGLASEILPKIFDAFIQVEQTIDRSQGGLGIGLTLVRRLLEMHGGAITVRSEGPGRGSVFSFRLPAAEAPAEAGDCRPAPSADGAGSRRPKVLIVDDNVDTAQAMARLLAGEGYEVCVAHDGREAVDAARDQLPRVLLLDIGLPGMDGYQVARQVRLNPDLADATLIAISGYGQDQDRRRSRDAGFDHHLVKPVDYDVLLPLLEAVPAPAVEA
jgi:signal transduction histidine kinase/DNA-binding response OmpR family regulator